MMNLSEKRGRRRLNEAVIDFLALEIIKGERSQGTSLPIDAVLVEQFQVSRTVIREALQALSDRGLVDIQHGSGTYVTSSDEWRLLDPSIIRLLERSDTFYLFAEHLVDVRRMFESEAAALAAERATSQEIEKLKSILSEMRLSEENAERYASLDVDFHTTIIVASHNVIIRGIRDQLSSMLTTMMRIRQRATLNRSHSTAMHELILTSIEERKPEYARAAMIAHLQGTERFFRERKA